MSVQSEINRINGAKTNIKTSIQNKGVTVPSTTKLDGYSALIDQIVTPDVTIYTGSGEPSASLGSDGDIYIKV